eukprot:scaffold35144_cov183-Skeletonema_dohrnii-CCMP3373.AAC.1
MTQHFTSRYGFIIAVLLLMSTVANISNSSHYFNAFIISNKDPAPQSYASVHGHGEQLFRHKIQPPGTIIYLEGGNENAGLGHSFMALNHMVTMAHQHNLSTRFVMRTKDKNHGFNERKAMRVKRYFFDDLFMNPLPDGETCVRIKSSPESLTDDVDRVKRESAVMVRVEQQQQNRSICTIFTMNYVKPNAHQMEQRLPLYRHLFELNDKNITRRSIIHRNATASTANVINIAMHIRRGDLFQFISKWGKSATHRLVPVSAYTSLLKQLLTKLFVSVSGDGVKREIRVTVHCEGIIGNATVFDVDGTMIDLQQEMIGLLDNNHNDVTFLAGDEDPLQAFDDICYSSNIFIAGNSAFSHLVGVLCPKPIILAMQNLKDGGIFMYSYDYIPNAIMLYVTRGNYSLQHPGLDGGDVELINSATFNETQFELRWNKTSPKS